MRNRKENISFLYQALLFEREGDPKSTFTCKIHMQVKAGITALNVWLLSIFNFKEIFLN
jgi:hypothetical protein